MKKLSVLAAVIVALAPLSALATHISIDPAGCVPIDGISDDVPETWSGSELGFRQAGGVTGEMFFVCALKEPASDWNKLAVAGSDPDTSLNSSFKVEVDYMSKPRIGGAVVTHASFDSTYGGGFDCEKSFTAFNPDIVNNTYFLLVRSYRGNTESTPRLRFIGLRASPTTYPTACP